MRLMSSVIFCADAPIDIGEDWLFLEVYCPKDTAAYNGFLLVQKALVKNGAYELLGHFQLKTMEQIKLHSDCIV